jgi:SLOG cluster2
MTSDPQLVPRSALTGHRVAISVSETSDLERLGLSQMHLRLTVAELSRAIVIAGGIVVYGGAINWGFTKIVLEEAEKYGNRSGAFEHFVPYSEHVGLSPEQLTDYAASLGVKSTVQLLDADGTPHSVDKSHLDDFARRDVEPAVALTAMRTLTAEVSDARIVVGGKVAGFDGAMPGVAEEAACTLKEGKPIYVAGGFGGAATLVGLIVAPDLYQWLPPDLPSGLTQEVRDGVVGQLDTPLSADGLREEERAVLAATHRPSDIATLVVLGLARHVGSSPEPG